MRMPIHHRIQRITQPVLINPTTQPDIKLHRIHIITAAPPSTGMKQQPLLQRGQRQNISDPHTTAFGWRATNSSRYPNPRR
jgi:hypothetical protein